MEGNHFLPHLQHTFLIRKTQHSLPPSKRPHFRLFPTRSSPLPAPYKPVPFLSLHHHVQTPLSLSRKLVPFKSLTNLRPGRQVNLPCLKPGEKSWACIQSEDFPLSPVAVQTLAEVELEMRGLQV